MSASLFTRVTKYSPSPALDPRENRLTEVTAAVLERVPAFARELLALLTPIERPVGPVEVETQRYVNGAGFLDLVLSWTEEGSAAELWVEVKHGAGWSSVRDDGTSQIDRYLSASLRAAARTTVVVVAPRRDLRGLKAAALGITGTPWEAVSELASQWPDNRNDCPESATFAPPDCGDPHPAVADFIVREYAEFLRHEGLMAPEPVTALDLESARNARRAIGAIVRVVTDAEADLPGAWAGPRKAAGRGDGRYRHFPPPASPVLDPGDYWIETKLDLSQGEAGVVLCGLTAWGEARSRPAWDLVSDGRVPEWSENLQARGFVRENDGLPRLWRKFELTRLLAPGAAGQTAELAGWLIETFGLVHDELGPAVS